MRQDKKAVAVSSGNGFEVWRTALWLVILGGALFFWPACLDPYLAPRFFFLSGALIIAFALVWKDKNQESSFRLHLLDVLLLGWYALNLASVGWSLSGSEGLFYAQKTLLLFGVYHLGFLALQWNSEQFWKTFGRITLVITAIVVPLLGVQIAMAAAKNGLDNESLYDFASGVFGNKSLAAEFLFFLLIFNILGWNSTSTVPRKWFIIYGIFGALILLILILILQVRTAYLATLLGLIFYGLGRASFDPVFRKLFLQKLLPAGITGIVLIIGMLVWKDPGGPTLQRLNPMHYLESATANERRFVWYKTDLLNADHYWLGVGNGSWKFWMPSKGIRGGYRLEEKNVVFTRAHNDYLEIRAEMGMVGAIWFCTLFGAAFLMSAWRIRQNKGVPETKSIARQNLLAACAGLAGYAVIQYFDFPRERIEFQVVLGILFAFIAHYTPGMRSRVFKKAFGQRFNIGLTILMLGLSFNLVIGWERMRGEIHTVRMLEAQDRKAWPKVAEESVLAENSFYQYTDSAMPLAWHEGIGWFQLGKGEKALAAFERAYQLNPWSFQVINNYASALVKLKRYPEAIPLFEKALHINPRYDEGKFNLGFVYFHLEDYSRAAEWLNRVDTIRNPGNEADRIKNRNTLKQLEDFRKVLKEKQQ